MRHAVRCPAREALSNEVDRRHHPTEQAYWRRRAQEHALRGAHQPLWRAPDSINSRLARSTASSSGGDRREQRGGHKVWEEYGFSGPS